MPKPVSLYLVDDDDAILDSLPYLLESFDLHAQPFASGSDFLEQVDLLLSGVVILDHRMPDLSGPELHQRLKQAFSPLQVIYLTGHGDLDMAVGAFREGAADFFQKPVDGQALATAIDRAWITSQGLHQKLAARRRLSLLTPRELEIYHLVVLDLTNKQVADKLCVSVRTVEVHRAKMMKKLELENVPQLVKFNELVGEQADV